jgi:hypothetical protein
VKARWKVENAQGLVKQGWNEKGEHVYFPLYSLKRVSWHRVSSVLRSDEEEDVSLYVLHVVLNMANTYHS